MNNIGSTSSFIAMKTSTKYYDHQFDNNNLYLKNRQRILSPNTNSIRLFSSSNNLNNLTEEEKAAIRSLQDLVRSSQKRHAEKAMKEKKKKRKDSRKKREKRQVVGTTTVSTLKATFENIDENDKTTTSNARKKKIYPKPKPKRLYRIDRILSNRGAGSRKEMNNCVKRKRVSYFDETAGEVKRINGPSERFPLDVRIFLDEKEILPIPLLIAHYKEKGVLSAMKDTARERPNLGDLLPPRYVKAGFHPVGRLDFDTSGLILFSSNGDLTQRLLNPRQKCEKEYIATVENTISNTNELREKLEDEGVTTAEGLHFAKLINVIETAEKLENNNGDCDNDDTEAGAPTVDENDEDSVGKSKGTLSDVQLVVTEGKHRMVRRMMANVGHPVAELKRIRFGSVHIQDMEPGSFRELSQEEIDWAEKLLLGPDVDNLKI